MRIWGQHHRLLGRRYPRMQSRLCESMISTQRRPWRRRRWDHRWFGELILGRVRINSYLSFWNVGSNNEGEPQLGTLLPPLLEERGSKFTITAAHILYTQPGIGLCVPNRIQSAAKCFASFSLCLPSAALLKLRKYWKLQNDKIEQPTTNVFGLKLEVFVHGLHKRLYFEHFSFTKGMLWFKIKMVKYSWIFFFFYLHAYHKYSISPPKFTWMITLRAEKLWYARNRWFSK